VLPEHSSTDRWPEGYYAPETLAPEEDDA